MANKKQYVKKLNDHENEILSNNDVPKDGVMTTIYNLDTGEMEVRYKPEGGIEPQGDPGNNGNPWP